jgi:hypothetical protein
MRSSDAALFCRLGERSIEYTSERFPRRWPEPLSAGVSWRLESSCSKSNRRATAGFDVSRGGLDEGTEAALGAMDDCLRGEDPSAVFIGDRDRGGGKCVRVLRRMCADVVMPGMEPGVRVASAHPF